MEWPFRTGPLPLIAALLLGKTAAIYEKEDEKNDEQKAEAAARIIA